jgi:8-oxo-dGTP pyrophosphatase MutT (NUDIX family)
MPPDDDPGVTPDAEVLAPIPGRSTRPSFDPTLQPWVANPGGLPAVPSHDLAPNALRARFAAPPVWQPEPPEAPIRRPAGDERPFRLASVLVPLVLRDEGLQVMLTQRTAHLHDHAGQISFPGGRVEKTDLSVMDAALRETEEETGLPRHLVEIIGQLPDYFTSTGFRIVPLVGLVQTGFTPVPDPFEVAEVFEVPLAFLMDPHNHHLHSVELPHNGRRTYYSMQWQQYFVWGATAGMLRDLYRFLSA